MTTEFCQKMENVFSLCYKEDEPMDLPPGFRFHPTDEELISHYLHPKVININFSCKAIGFVDLNKSEPWDLPWKANMGEKEWYFFCMRDRKYPTGLRTNRATDAGYWKATGKDKEIYKGKSLVGMKKTLVFYRGRAPKGEKTNWVMHEYRLDGKLSVHNLPQTAKNEWVISRVFQKTIGGKKTHISGIMRVGSCANELSPSGLPPLMDSSSPQIDKTKPLAESAYVPCFSNSMNFQRNQGGVAGSCFNTPLSMDPSIPSVTLPRVQLSGSFYSNTQSNPFPETFSVSGSVYDVKDESFIRTFLQNHGMASLSQETGLTRADMNTEISSMVSNFEMCRRPFPQEAHPILAASVELDKDTWWNC